MTTPGGALTTDLDLMTAVAAGIDTRNDDIRALLAAFIGRMASVPPSVWGGAAAVRFRDVVERWNRDSTALDAALTRIAETIRANQATLGDAAAAHATRLGAVGR